MIQDLRYALRQLRKNPAFAIVAVSTLALGIGASAAMFGLIQGVLLTPPPFADPDRVVLVTQERLDGTPYDQRPTTAQVVAWRQSPALAATALYRWTFNFLVLDEGSESLGGMVVSTDFFKVLGVRPALGRLPTDGEAATSKTPPTAVVIGHELWRRKFASDPNVIGRTIRISRQPAPLPIVGVMPPGLRFLPDPANESEPNYDVDAHVDFWAVAVPDESQPKSRGWNVVARLRAGAGAAEAGSQVAGTTARLARSDADLEGLTAAARPVQDVLNADGRRLLVPLFASVGVLFLIACTNVAGLLLARGLQRQQEYAMRAALGAGRRRLWRLVLTESAVTAIAGAAAGSALAAGLIAVLKAVGGDAVPRADAVGVGWTVYAFGLAAAILGSMLAGLLPASRAARAHRSGTLHGSRASLGRTERRLLGAVATLQIVLTVALLAGAALLVRTARNLAQVRPGYDTEHILAMTVTTMQREQWKSFHSRALERVAVLPGVARTAFVWGLPLTGNKWGADMELPGRPGSTRLVDRINFPLRAVTPDYFGVMGMRLVEGRGFQISDDEKAPPVAIVNATLARRHFGTSAPIGQRLRFAGNQDRFVEIVGVVADTRTEALSAEAEPEVYLPFWQNGAFSKHLVVRALGEPDRLAPLVRRELRAIDPTAAVEHITTMAEIRRASLAPRTFALRLLAGFAVAATLLSLVGLYGVLSLSVGARTKEIAVRKAIGARGREIVALVLGEAGGLIAGGLIAGVVAAVLLGRLLETLLFGVRPADPLALGGAALVFGAVALMACAVPAYRAARVDLMESLRQE